MCLACVIGTLQAVPSGETMPRIAVAQARIPLPRKVCIDMWTALPGQKIFFSMGVRVLSSIHRFV
jgi:hypothetical protein